MNGFNRSANEERKNVINAMTANDVVNGFNRSANEERKNAMGMNGGPIITSHPGCSPIRPAERLKPFTTSTNRSHLPLPASPSPSSQQYQQDQQHDPSISRGRLLTLHFPFSIHHHLAQHTVAHGTHDYRISLTNDTRTHAVIPPSHLYPFGQRLQCL